MAEYKLVVSTGCMTNAGTVDHIYVTLFGTEGQSERTKLDKFGITFLPNTTQCFTVETKSSLGNLLLLQLEKDPFLILTEDQWYCSKIVVTAPEGELLFPCNRWISRGELVELRGGKAMKVFEECSVMLIENRKKDLLMRKDLYQWEITDEKLPNRLHAKEVSDLPAELQLSMTKEIELDFTKKTTGIELLFKGLVGSNEQWEKIEDMKKIFTFQKTAMSEYVAEHWMEDEFFGYQFLNGTNPCGIRKCSKLPPYFPVTDEMVQPFLRTGCSLNEEMERGNIFIRDTKILKDIPTRMYGEESLQMPASMCLFYMNLENKLMPIAIQLNQQPSEQNPIFLPSDSETDWLLAKMFVKSADTMEFEAVHHLMGTHYLAEVFTVATLRNLPPIHPLYKLLMPHFRYTLHINVRGRHSLFGPEGAFSISTLGYAGTTELIRRGVSEMSYSSLCLPDNITARGLESIPNYYYRDDGLKLWNIINGFVRRMMEYYYPSNMDVIKDTELQGWIQEIFTHGFLGNYLSGIPAYFTKVMDLVKFLTMVIFTVTAQHAALNNGQFDYLSWILNGSLLLRQPPPTTKGQSSLDTILETIPNIGETVKFAAFVLVLSEKYSDMVVLGSYPDELFDESTPKHVIHEFQTELSTLSEVIKARNAGLEVPYTYLDPAQIENSVTI